MNEDQEMDSMYGDGKPDANKAKTIDEQEQMTAAALVPLKVLTGKNGPPKEGDEVVLRVKKIHGDEAEVEYAPEPEKEETEEQPDANAELDEMNEKY